MTKKTSLWQRLKDALSNPDNATPAPENSDNDNPYPLEQGLFSKDLTGDVIVDLADNAQAAQEIGKITADDLDVMLASMGYQFTYHPPKAAQDGGIEGSPLHHFSMQVGQVIEEKSLDGQMVENEREWGCLLRFFEKEQLLAVYSVFPFNVPESHRGEMLAVIAYLNFDLVLGNLELDLSDGELRFKTSLDLEVTGLSEYVLAYLLQSNFSVTARLFDTVAEVLAKAVPATNASEAVDSLLSTQQAKTFYLMSDRLQ